MHLVNDLFQGKTADEALPAYERFQQGEVWAEWRRETVREIRELLAGERRRLRRVQQSQPAQPTPRHLRKPELRQSTLRALLLSAAWRGPDRPSG
jgi:hypothetical protein